MFSLSSELVSDRRKMFLFDYVSSSRIMSSSQRLWCRINLLTICGKNTRLWMERVKEELVFSYAVTGKEGVKELFFSSCNVSPFVLGDCRFCTPGTRVWILSLSLAWINMGLLIATVPKTLFLAIAKVSRLSTVSFTLHLFLCLQHDSLLHSSLKLTKLSLFT